MNEHRVSIAICLLATSIGNLASAENWPQFRGADASGVARKAQLPVEWSADKEILWKIELPGVGWSQPIVWNDKVFLTSAESDQQKKPATTNKGPGGAVYEGGAAPKDIPHKWKLICLDLSTGKLLWERIAHEGPPVIPIHANNTYASETPVTDGEHVVAYFGMCGVYCYDFDGNLKWKDELGPRRMQYGWGTGSSPMLYENLVYLQCDNEEASFLAAYDIKTGDQAWRIERDEKTNWSTPYIWKNKLRTELVTAGGTHMQSYDPKTGDALWSMKGSGRTATTPLGDDELLYVDSYDRVTGTKGQLVAIRPGASGDITLKPEETTSEHVAWTMPIQGGRMSSPAICGELLYVLENFGGILRCADARTGESHYRKRIPGASGFMSSPIVSDNKIYCTDQDCNTFVLEAGPELKVLATNEIGEMCWSSAAVAGNVILLRTTDHLYAVGTK